MIAAANPPTTRSLLVLGMAAEIARREPPRQARAIVTLAPGRDLALFGSSTLAGIHAVAAGEVALAIVNPSAMLTLAYRGNGPFAEPLPLRTIGVIPTRDAYAFAVRPETGLRTFADIAERRPALRIGVRSTRDHSLHPMRDDIMRAHGFSRDDVRAWGGTFRYDGQGAPHPGSPALRALIDGEVDALWDEGANSWVGAALAAGMTILPLADAALARLETWGYRRTIIAQSRFPQLPADVPTVDFSGWPLFVRADLGDDDVERICAGLAACVESIPWQEDAPLTLARMCGNAADAPYDVPLHPVAERAWRAAGVLPA